MVPSSRHTATRSEFANLCLRASLPRDKAVKKKKASTTQAEAPQSAQDPPPPSLSASAKSFKGHWGCTSRSCTACSRRSRTNRSKVSDASLMLWPCAKQTESSSRSAMFRSTGARSASVLHFAGGTYFSFSLHVTGLFPCWFGSCSSVQNIIFLCMIDTNEKKDSRLSLSFKSNFCVTVDFFLSLFLSWEPSFPYHPCVAQLFFLILGGRESRTALRRWHTRPQFKANNKMGSRVLCLLFTITSWNWKRRPRV